MINYFQDKQKSLIFQVFVLLFIISDIRWMTWKINHKQKPLPPRLIHNYDQLNELGQDTLVTYSDDIASMPKYTDEPAEDKKQA